MLDADSAGGFCLSGIIGAAANYGNVLSMRYRSAQRVVADHAAAPVRASDEKRYRAVSYAQACPGRLVSRFTNDINLLRSAFTENVLTAMAKGALTTAFLIGIMFYQNWELALIALCVFPIAIHPLIRLGKRVRKIS